MGHDVLGFHEIRQTPIAGGKATQLAELSRIDGVRVPPGFCITTEAFERVVIGAPTFDEPLNRLNQLQAESQIPLRRQSRAIRRAIERVALPETLGREITQALARLGLEAGYAVRSSATLEDAPTTSFAGQHDTFLNVVGPKAVLEHVRRCWASLFSERAVAYRVRHGIDHRHVRMAVVVQEMVSSEAAGVLFTADPISGHRRIAAIEACIGLGDALVSGITNGDKYAVRDDRILTKTIATKAIAVYASPSGGTERREIADAHRRQAALTDPQVLRLTALGRRIEAHFGRPQDIEWCLKDDDFQIVQSRPITTLFPIPESGDARNRVYVSVGHQQMMTDPMRPLGLSMWNLTTPRPMSTAGGRLFVDVTHLLATEPAREGFLAMAGRSDPLLRDALQTIIDRGDFIPSLSDPALGTVPPAAAPGPAEAGHHGTPAGLDADPAIVAELTARGDESIVALTRDIETKSGAALLDFILADLQELKRSLFDPQSMSVIMAAMEATWWLNDRLFEWLGEKQAADILTLSAPNNVTSQMGLALLNVADVIRPHVGVVAFLENTRSDAFLDELPRLSGGLEARDAISAWLDRYGMRGVGEIDITRPRWREQPHLLLPVILGHIRNVEAGEGARRFDEGQEVARRKEEEILTRLRALPNGEHKAAETKRMIDRVRTFIGYRERPKYGKVCRYFIYKQALLAESQRLTHAGVLREPEDIFFLTFDELQDVVRTQRVDDRVIRERREAFHAYQALTPPRVMTSDGEALTGAYRRDHLPAGALVGLAVSAGTVEGRARVVMNMSDAQLQPGDILVTTYTDPSWTPLFVAVKGLITEVGGLMTHGAVIAREYGLPAVVGVEHATRLIRDGQRIRLHGSDGYVECLD